MATFLKILIVDNSDEFVRRVVTLLESDGVVNDVACVSSPDEFRTTLDASTDVVLVHHNPPSFDSFSFLELAEERTLGIPVIVISEVNDVETAVAAMQNGASDYLFIEQLSRLSSTIQKNIDRAILKGDEHRQRADERDSYQRLKLALAASAMGVWEWNFKTDEVIWSPEVYDIFRVESPIKSKA
ncbi:MAG: response regulator, partial [Planctomycetes bacterium]|nr:response regulator [Planctomycetota bacterium]